jgi:hypothetical protein
MAGKRTSPPRRLAASAEDARPRRNVRSTYVATQPDDKDLEVQDQQLASEVQQEQDLTSEQELQQLQDQLQAMQQERDRVAAAYAAS